MDEKCNVCGKPATVVDTEYDEFYCDDHAEQYNVFDGPYRRLQN